MERGKREREGGQSVRWRFEGGNELPASTTLVMTRRLPCLSLSSPRRSFPSVIPRQWSHLKPPARRQNDSLDSLLNEMLHFPIPSPSLPHHLLSAFPKIETLYFSFVCAGLYNTRFFAHDKIDSYQISRLSYFFFTVRATLRRAATTYFVQFIYHFIFYFLGRFFICSCLKPLFARHAAVLFTRVD